MIRIRIYSWPVDKSVENLKNGHQLASQGETSAENLLKKGTPERLIHRKSINRAVLRGFSTTLSTSDSKSEISGICNNTHFVLVEEIWFETGIELQQDECPGMGNLSEQSFQREWCRGPDLNWGHPPFQGGALPTELPRHDWRGRPDLNRRSLE